jgi:hypothetical protein
MPQESALKSNSTFLKTLWESYVEPESSTFSQTLWKDVTGVNTAVRSNVNETVFG